MGGAVIGVEYLDERAVGEEPLLNGLFVEESHRALKLDDLHRIVESTHGDLGAVDIDRSELITGQRIDQIKGAHDEDFLPPPSAVFTHLVGCGGLGGLAHVAPTIRPVARRVVPPPRQWRNCPSPPPE